MTESDFAGESGIIVHLAFTHQRRLRFDLDYWIPDDIFKFPPELLNQI